MKRLFEDLNTVVIDYMVKKKIEEPKFCKKCDITWDEFRQIMRCDFEGMDEVVQKICKATKLTERDVRNLDKFKPKPEVLPKHRIKHIRWTDLDDEE